MKTILAFGGGVDSSTLLAMHLDREGAARHLGMTLEALNELLPAFDHIVFCDLGAESGATMENIQKAKGLAEASGIPFDLIAKDGENILEWVQRLGIVPVMPGGSHICSKKFKGDVMQKWAEAQGFGPVHWIIGIEADEGRRTRFTAPKGQTSAFVWPLIDLDLTRADCEEMLIALGWGKVEKSSCVFCPFKQEWEIRDMWMNDREAWELCEAVEKNFELTSAIKHQRWLDAGQPLNKAGRAPVGMWRMDSWKNGARLFVKRIEGRQLSMGEWAARFEAEKVIPLKEVA